MEIFLPHMLAGDSGIDAFFDCNEKTNNPQSQDDIGNVIPPDLHILSVFLLC